MLRWWDFGKWGRGDTFLKKFWPKKSPFLGLNLSGDFWPMSTALRIQIQKLSTTTAPPVSWKAPPCVYLYGLSVFKVKKHLGSNAEFVTHYLVQGTWPLCASEYLLQEQNLLHKVVIKIQLVYTCKVFRMVPITGIHMFMSSLGGGSLVAKSRWTLGDPIRRQHCQLPCPSLSPGVCAMSSNHAAKIILWIPASCSCYSQILQFHNIPFSDTLTSSCFAIFEAVGTIVVHCLY